MKVDYAGWHPKIQVILDAADHNERYRRAINNCQPIRTWCTARVTLLGDTAHPNRPVTIQGAVRAHALEGSGSVSLGLDLYQCNRVDRTARVALESTPCCYIGLAVAWPEKVSA